MEYRGTNTRWTPWSMVKEEAREPQRERRGADDDHAGGAKSLPF